jgi:UDP-glucuronate 4-epimerase
MRLAIYASSSSVYGMNSPMPFSTMPPWTSRYRFAATKRANELMAYTYAHLYRLPVTGLRFFTVYGPVALTWRCSSSPAILDGRPIDIYNNGEMSRDFTYVDDVVEGIVRIQDCPPQPEQPARRPALYNIGLGAPVQLLDMVHCVEAIGRKPSRTSCPCSQAMCCRPGPMSTIWFAASTSAQSPRCPRGEALCQWYRDYGADCRSPQCLNVTRQSQQFTSGNADMSNSPFVSVLIPAKNEAQNLPALLQEVRQALPAKTSR